MPTFCTIPTILQSVLLPLLCFFPREPGRFRIDLSKPTRMASKFLASQCSSSLQRAEFPLLFRACTRATFSQGIDKHKNLRQTFRGSSTDKSCSRPHSLLRIMATSSEQVETAPKKVAQNPLVFCALLYSISLWKTETK